MEVHVDDRPVELIPGMTVRHALIAAFGGMLDPASFIVRDQWGHLLGIDGVLHDGARIVTELLAGNDA